MGKGSFSSFQESPNPSAYYDRANYAMDVHAGMWKIEKLTGIWW
jgi:hypothetical protein